MPKATKKHTAIKTTGGPASDPILKMIADADLSLARLRRATDEQQTIRGKIGDENTSYPTIEGPLVLLRHKFLRGMFLCIGVAQHGHLDNLLARATLRRMRSVAIEFGTCRWVRNGGAS